jgi:hypothetical protein
MCRLLIPGIDFKKELTFRVGSFHCDGTWLVQRPIFVPRPKSKKHT